MNIELESSLKTDLFTSDINCAKIKSTRHIDAAHIYYKSDLRSDEQKEGVIKEVGYSDASHLKRYMYIHHSSFP